MAEQAFAPPVIPACSVAALKFLRQITGPPVPRLFASGMSVANPAPSHLACKAFEETVLWRCLFLRTFEVVFVREPSLLPVFGKLGVKAPVLTAAAPTMSKSVKSMVPRMREVLSSHGSLALKLSVVVWTIVILAAVFVITQA
jgi:hypothetical protein